MFEYLANVLVGGLVAAFLLALVQFVNCDETFGLIPLILSKLFVITGP